MNRFRYLIGAAFAVFLLLNSVACSHTYVNPGYVGVKVYLHGSSKGVDHEILTPGAYYIGMNEEVYLFPTFLQNYNYTKSSQEGKPIDESFSFQDKQGMTISSDVGISYSFASDKIDKVFQKFHKGPEEITNVFLRSILRDSFNRVASTRDIQDIYGPGKAQFITDVQNEVVKQAVTYGIQVEKVLLINELRLPGEIVRALNEKNMATQKAMQAENELRVTQAEAAKQVAQAVGAANAKVTYAKGEAEANRLVAASITPTLVEKMRVEKWDGHMPQVQGSGSSILDMRK